MINDIGENLKNFKVWAGIMSDLFGRGSEKMFGSTGSNLMTRYLDMVTNKPIYRIELHEDSSNVETMCYDLMDGFSPKLNKFYESVDELPKWVQDTLSVLMVVDHTKVNQEIEKVGRRISKDVFWVYDRDEEDGINTRS